MKWGAIAPPKSHRLSPPARRSFFEPMLAERIAGGDSPLTKPPPKESAAKREAIG